MSHSASTYDLNNEQLLLINILNTMYNDNMRQIYNYNDNISTLNVNNTQIRNLIFQIFSNSNYNHFSQNSIRPNRDNNSNSIRNSNSTSTSNSNSNNLGRVVLNNIPYIIENIEEYRIPLRPDRNETLNQNFSQILQNFFQPVEVFPTPTQIELATRIVRYNDIITPLNRSCPISLENFNENDIVTMIRFCGHIFNTEELNTWFRSNCRCPVCRYDIRTFNISATSDVIEDIRTNSDNNLSQNTNENSINIEPTNISNINVERNQTINNIPNNNNTNSITLINRLINDLNSQDNENINLFTDISGNLLNNLTNYDSILRLLNTLNNNHSI